ncbi:hypothetical protein N7493_009525 [Penicillium malachiteum]|uniref:Uncharacterized protein n=1 Tax=Penicillium malachiteum TaxID=1324776 RepID=A0AAD6HEP2_9EURO|nr:hypothetical protein N7493_009525 [Penicillium malachiteum]
MDLHTAASQGSIVDIQSEIEKGTDVNARNQYDRTPLWLAVMNGHLDACTVLLAEGADAKEPEILEHAVHQGHAKIIELLWPHCEPKVHYRYLENAITSGSHDIADSLVKSGIFKDRYSQDTGIIDMLDKEGFSKRGNTAFQQWERFIFVRRSENIQLHPTLFNYALILAAKADRNSGMRLLNLLLGGDNPLADVNCRIKIHGEIETPLTCAAGQANLEILAILIQHPDIDLALCGKYGWPAFIHLLMTLDSKSSSKGWNMAHMLCKDGFPDSCLAASTETDWEIVYKNVIRHGEDDLVDEVINLVRGHFAETPIIPLLIRANQTYGVEWILSHDIACASEPSPDLWVVLCEFLQCNPASDALECFIRAAEIIIEKGIWDPMILVCLNLYNFSFVKQFFYPANKILPPDVTEETLKGLSMAMIDRSLIGDWADKGFAKTLLWSAIQSDVWKDEAFEIFLSSPYINPNEPFLRRKSSREERAHACSTERSEDLVISLDSSIPPRQHSDNNQFSFKSLKEQVRRAELSALKQKQKRCPLAWAVGERNLQLVDVLLRSSGVDVNFRDKEKKTPLIHAINANDQQIVERLLRVPSIDLNIPDFIGRTAVFHAAVVGNLHIIQMLIETRKVDLSTRDYNGNSALELAKRIGKQDTTAALTT